MNKYILAFKFNSSSDESAEHFAQYVAEYVNSLEEKAVTDIQVGLTRVEEAVAEE